MTHSPPPAMPGRSHAPPPTSGVGAMRDRSRALADQMGRRDQQSQPQTVRELVQVIDGGTGNFPTQPDQVAIANPVEIDADDVEGATPTFTPDTNQPIPVVFIRNAPQVGDLAVAHAIAGRWVAELGGGTKVCVNDWCVGPLPGALVQVLDGSGNVVASCTTGSDGCCKIGVSGTYTVRVTAGGTLFRQGTFTFTPGQTTSIGNFPLQSDRVYCCHNHKIPYDLTLTGPYGTIPFVYQGVNNLQWQGTQVVTFDNIAINVGFCGTNRLYCQVGSGSVTITYEGWCSDALGDPYPHGQFVVRLRVATAFYFDATQPDGVPCAGTGWHLMYDSAIDQSNTDPKTCTYVQNTAIGAVPGGGVAELAKAPSSWSPFAWSGALVANGGNGCPVPGLNVAISV